MALATVHTACLHGVRVLPVRVEADIQPGLPYCKIIGLPDKRIDEARQRVRSAIKNSGFPFPKGRITVNLSPSDVPKQGTGFDLAIALALLVAAKSIPSVPADVWVFGELSLDGAVLPAAGAAAVLVESTRWPVQGCVVSRSDAEAALSVDGCRYCLVESLAQLVFQLPTRLSFEYAEPMHKPVERHVSAYAIDQIGGQAPAKRALEIAVAGGHNLFLTGPPGAGKTMLAKATGQLLPPMGLAERQAVVQLYALAGEPLSDGADRPPFRAPHHSVSQTVLRGGGASSRPGELSLAHGGILFLDEFSEFRRDVREALRQPLQDREVRLQRGGREERYPADCLVIAAQNSCPCGLSGVEGETCRCAPGELERYRRRLSEPLLERFDLFCELRKVGVSEWAAPASQEGKGMADRIDQARRRQYARQGAGRLNSRLSPKEAREFCRVGEQAEHVLRKAAAQYYLSARGTQKVLAAARSIADLAGSEGIEISHLQEALQYRRRRAVP